MGLERIRTEEPVENTVHNLIQTLSVKLDAAARYGIYQEDARNDGDEDSAELFARLSERDRQAIHELLERLGARIGAVGREGSEERHPKGGSDNVGAVSEAKLRQADPGRAATEEKDVPAKVNPIQAQKFLKGMDYPATRETVVAHAEAQGADENVIAVLRRIADREYEGPSGISEEIGKVQ